MDPQEARESQILNQLKQVRNACDRIVSSQMDISSRLSMVLRDEPPQPDKKGEEKLQQAALVPLASDLKEIVDHLEHINASQIDLLDRPVTCEIRAQKERN